MFHDWTKNNPYDWFEIVPVELPGRGTRRRERPLVRMEELRTDFLRYLAQRPGSESFALYGHSLGANICYEIARGLDEAGRMSPLALLTSGAAAPGHGRWLDIHHLPDRELMSSLAQLGGTPREILDDPDLMEVALPAVRADLALYADHLHRLAGLPALRCPVTALGAQDDRLVSPDSVPSWSTMTTAEFTCRIVPGDHFFVYEDDTIVAAALAELLRPWAPRPRPSGSASDVHG